MPTLKTAAAIIFTQCAIAVPAFAHPGHIAATGGHDHWIAGAAIGAAVAVAAWGALRAWRSRAESTREVESEAEGQTDPENDEPGARA